MPYIYAFDHKHRKSPMDMKDLLGGKGANLAEMTSVLGLPVPAGFTITTDACRAYMADGWPKGLDVEISKHLASLEKTMGRKLGDPVDPLLVSVRSGAKFSMPGMMDTVLNLGLNDESVGGLAKQTDDERFAYDSYRRFISMYGRIVLDIDGELFDRLLDTAKEWDGVESDADVSAETLRRLCDRYKDVVRRETGKPFPQDPLAQLKGAIEAVFRSWNGARAIAYRVRERISHDLGTAVNVQAMVFGNRDDNSGTGVGFTRNAATGENKPYGDFLVNAQGEDVVAGIRNTEALDALAQHFPKMHKQLLGIFAKLEEHYRDMCDTEFTIEQGKLWMLQTRVGKRTGVAALRMAVDMTKGRKWKISKEDAVLRITEDHLDQVLHPQFARQDNTVIAKGLAASPGAAVGRVYFTADDAADAADRGEKVVLVRTETSPEDVHGMIVAEGILTSRGGLVSHAAVVARGWGKPAVVGAESIRIAPGRFVAGDVVVHEGDVVSIDGSTGSVVLGEVALSSAEPPDEFTTILSWADDIRRGHLQVRANADSGPDAANARQFGAEGIGLCRTEHMFLGDDRLPIVRRMILADTATEEAAALEELRVAQKADFEDILAAMDGLPVTVRLLDPPLHEFLPSTEELAIKAATEGLTDEEAELYEAAKQWHEFNPMLGTRGVRLGVVKPGLYAMQVRALMEAAAERVKNGGRPIIEIMIPLTITQPELTMARGWCQEAIDDAQKSTKRKLDVTIGTMIETPRACIRADDIAIEADFFSFGTNDLTQMTLGFSRDDVEGRMMEAYLEYGLLKRNPFETLDDHGVGELVRLGAKRGRTTKPGLKLGVCGEHGGDPESIQIFHDAGLDYVSCSPFRVPIARLAAAAGGAQQQLIVPANLAVAAASTAAANNDSFASFEVTPFEWLAFIALVSALLLVDLLVLHRKPHVIPVREAAIETAGWVAIGLAFGLLVLTWHGGQAAGEYWTGYLLELSLSVDNVFVWAVILTFFVVPAQYQFRVLFWGVFGALVLRAAFIFAGVALIEQFSFVLYIFGAILLWSAWKIARHDENDAVDLEHSRTLAVVRRFIPSTTEYDGQKLFTRQNGKRLATPLFAVLVLVESTDVVFAVDSVPAVLAVAREQFIVFSSNAFAILGLRSMYFLLAGVKDRFRYLNVGLGIILASVGIKMLLSDFVHLPALLSLGIIVVVLAGAISLSLAADRRDARAAGMD